MATQEKLFEDFPPNTFEQWMEKVEKELKGKKLKDLAQRSRAEEIYLDPLFTELDKELQKQQEKIDWLMSYKASNEWEILENNRSMARPRIDVSEYHNNGANATQELAIALSRGNAFLSMQTEGEKSVDDAVRGLEFHFAIGNDFLLEIAKFRAFRLIWASVLQQYRPQNSKTYFAKISAETSLRVYQKVEEYTNLLRATTQAMSAGIGGVNAVYVYPFNVKTETSNFSEKLVINLQRVILEEGRLSNVIDAARGSWYVERLTDILAQKAWKLFIETEEKGEAWFQGQVAKTQAIRKEDEEAGKETVLGVNKYILEK